MKNVKKVKTLESLVGSRVLKDNDWFMPKKKFTRSIQKI